MANTKTYKYNANDIMTLPPIIKRPSISGPLDVSSVIPKEVADSYLNKSGDGLGKYGGSYNGQILSVIDTATGKATPKIISEDKYEDFVTTASIKDSFTSQMGDKVSLFMESIEKNDYELPFGERTKGLPTWLVFCAAAKTPYFFHGKPIVFGDFKGGTLTYNNQEKKITSTGDVSFSVSYEYVTDKGVFNYYDTIELVSNFSITHTQATTSLFDPESITTTVIKLQ